MSQNRINKMQVDERSIKSKLFNDLNSGRIRYYA